MSEKNSKTTGRSIDETREYHIRYLRAINNPLRREILKTLRNGPATFEDLLSSTRLDEETLKWHLKVLENGFCIEKNAKQGKTVYKLTKEGRVIDYLE